MIGKTTTTTLIYEILKNAKYNCYLGGNIGTPLFDKLPEMKKEDIIVLELSSFQLMNMDVSPNISVITNITPNHLDIHKSYEEYIESKKNIFRFQNEKDILVLNYNNEIVKRFEKEVVSNVVFFSNQDKLENGVMLNNDIIKYAENGIRRQLINVKDVKLRGNHNYENICTAIAATLTLVDIGSVIKVVKEFKGVEHRLEFIREIDGVKWYNDSIGSSPTRTVAGLKSFEENITLIAGGYDKHLEYEPLAKPILDNAVTLILLGQTATKIEEAVLNELQKIGGIVIEKKEYKMLKYSLNGKEKLLEIFRVNSLEESVKVAYKYTKKEQVVLFSPASASFDMFKNFMERGEKFKDLVNNI